MRDEFIEIEVRLSNQINLTRTKQRTKIQARTAHRPQQKPKRARSPDTSDTFVVVVFITFFRWLGILLAGDSDDVDVAYSCSR